MAAQYTQGTVPAANPFDAEQAAQALRKAMKGLGTDEKAIIRVMSSNNKQQLQEINTTYKTMFGKDLRSDLKSEISGKFEDLVIALLELPVNYDAKEIRDAIKGIGTKENTLIEILCTRSNQQIEEIKKAYKTLYKRDLEKDLKGDTSGHFERLLVSQLTANRDQNPNVDPALGAQDADDLFQAGAKKTGTDEATFNRILSLRSYPQLVCAFDTYQRKHKHEIEHDIKSETSGYLEDGYLAIASFARNPQLYFAERLHASMAGAGTKDRNLIRLVVTRCEVDMVQIKSEFERKYSKSLGKFIKDDTSGDYRKLLLALCNEPA